MALFVLLTYIVIRISLWVYKELYPVMKQTIKETYNLKTKKEIAEENDKTEKMEKDIKYIKELLKPAGLTEGDIKSTVKQSTILTEGTMKK